ncbi:AMP-binding protein [Vibrio sp. PP-XX7]
MSSFSFDACVSEWVMALCQGAALHLPRPGRLMGDELQQHLLEQQITHVTITPALLSGVDLSQTNLPDLKTLLTAGEAVSQAQLAPWVAPHRQIFNAYGPTECTVCATMYPHSPDEAGPPPIGGPLDGVRMYILDAFGQPVPIGVPGELYIGGAQVGRGYLNRPELTEERFLPDPFAETPDARMYKTGDVGNGGKTASSNTLAVTTIR